MELFAAVALLACVTAAAGATGPQRSSTYKAFGSGAAWSLTIDPGRMTYVPAQGPPIAVRAPARREDQIGWSYQTRALSVQAFGGGCKDPMSGRRYADSVWVTVKGRELQGCGGTEIPAGSLIDTAWMIAGIAGTSVRGPSYAIDFSSSSFIAYTGCNRIGGTYVQTGDTLTMIPTGGTVIRCAQPTAGCERRLTQILKRPMKVSFPDKKTLLLRNGAGSLRLYDPAVEDDIFKTSASPCPSLPE